MSAITQPGSDRHSLEELDALHNAVGLSQEWLNSEEREKIAEKATKTVTSTPSRRRQGKGR